MAIFQMPYNDAYANASSVRTVESQILSVNASGVIPVEMFNRIEAAQIEHESRQVVSEPFFGANVRDAIRLIREWRAASHGQR